MEFEFNKYQSSIEELGINNCPLEILEQFTDFIYNIPLVLNLTSLTRRRAKDLPRDGQGRILVDVTSPHILEDMDYFRPSALYFLLHGCYTNLRPNRNPNSDYGKWIREETRRCREGYVRESDGEWIPGDYYFFLNYCPMLLSEKDNSNSKKANRVMSFPKIWDGHYLKFHYLHLARNNGKHAVELASRQKGKAHPYSQIVYTPDGVKLWGDIKIGDKLFGDDGKETTVVDIPFDSETDIYKVTLSDGRSLECSLGHLFKIRDVRKATKNQIKVLSLELILKSDYYHLRKNGKYEAYYSIPSNKGVDFKEREVMIDPYTLGLAIGDGCFRTGYANTLMFTSTSEDVKTYIKYSPYPLYPVKGKYAYRFNIPNIRNYLILYGLEGKDSSNKFIPKNYLFNSRKIRLNILRGILDSDGTVNNNGIPMLTTTSKLLCKDVVFLCRSLGYNTRMFEKVGKYYGKICKKTYNISILTNDPIFRLERKLKLLTNFKSNNSRAKRDWTHIVNIEYSHVEKAKCVTVDNSSHCYLIGDFITTHNSFCAAALLTKRFGLGESEKVKEKVTCYATASEKGFLVKGDQTLDKFLYNIDFLAQNTEWPYRDKLINTIQNMLWVAGYKDLDTETRRGTLNAVMGTTAKDDESKLRGTRGVLYIIEEAGSFPRLLQLWNNLLPSVLDGEDTVYGLLFAFGTSGDSLSDFSAMAEMMYKPRGYHVYRVENVYDLKGKGGKDFAFFFPAYMNFSGCYDNNGNSNVTKAIFSLLKNRYNIKYNSTDISTITRTIAEYPITPQEAVLRTTGSIFPTALLTERLNEIDSNPNIFDDVYTGDLFMNSKGEVLFKLTNELPIRDYPLKDNTASGCFEIFLMPEKDKNNKITPYRYIASLDPYNNDLAESKSLGSFFVLDLLQDRIVCEYTGRTPYLDDFFEKVRLACIFYNAKCLYESNSKGAFSYFSKKNSLHLLADTPEYLRDKQIIKYSSFGSSSKGVNASKAVNVFADNLTRDWLLKPVPIIEDERNETVERSVPNLYFIKNRALLRELISYNPYDNFDRIRSLGILMLYREEKMILYQGDIKSHNLYGETDYAGNDEFFTENYDRRFDTESLNK